uniref:Uncharacterized protein n=1 Tax=Anguilla anguilla TaxID=7936 RepID=A0A0E9TG53_ANGAN
MTNPENRRPVSLLNVNGKIYQRLFPLD